MACYSQAQDQVGPAIKDAATQTAPKLVTLNVKANIMVYAGSYVFKCNDSGHCTNLQDPRIDLDVFSVEKQTDNK